jgi:pyrophosphatase PpaX
MKKYSYYLFDADGTLFDTTELIYKCFLYTLKKFKGPKKTKQEIIQNIGLTLRGQLETYFGVLTDERYNQISKEHMKYQLSIYKKYLKLFPNVSDTIKILSKNGCFLGVVSSRRKDTLDLYLKETGIYNFFNVIVSPEDTIKHKPEPEPIIKAISLLGAKDKSTVLYIGDSEYDIECGFRAGIDTAFVKWSKNNYNEFSFKPTYILENIFELCKE